MTIDRKQQIQDVVDKYVNKYTTAVMGDFCLDKEEKYCEEANNWLREQRKNLDITKEELKIAIVEAQHKAHKKQTACCYDVFEINA